MGGGKKKRGRRWCSVAALKKLSVPTFARKIVLLRFSKNGMHPAMLLLNTAKESLGIGSSTRESIYSKHLHGIIAYGFAVQRRCYKSKIFGHCREGTKSLPSFIPSHRSIS